MPQSKRDPRRNPKIGDIVKDARGQVHVRRECGPGESFDVRLWRKAVKQGRVIHAAE